MAFGESVECLTRNKFLSDLPFEFDAMRTVLGHGSHPLRARPRSIPNLQDVHRKGCTPQGGHYCPRFCNSLDPALRPPTRLSICGRGITPRLQTSITRFFVDIVAKWTFQMRAVLSDDAVTRRSFAKVADQQFPVAHAVALR
jgi:hypothetical protein